MLAVFESVFVLFFVFGSLYNALVHHVRGQRLWSGLIGGKQGIGGVRIGSLCLEKEKHL